MKAVIVEKDESMLVLRPENDPSNLVLIYPENDPQFAQRRVGDVLELEGA
jgi:hypothetical protein